MSYQQPGTDRHTSGLSMAALLLAALAPPVGFVLGLIARAQAKRAGSPTGGATLATIIGATLSVIWSVGLVALVWGGASLLAPASNGPTTPPVPDSTKSLVVEVSADHDLDAETLAAARTVVERHATQAGMVVLAVTESGGDSLVVSFDEDTPDTFITRFGRSLGSPPETGFSRVFAVLPGDGGQVDGYHEKSPACGELPFGTTTWNELAVVCDDADEVQYLFVEGPRVPGSDIAEVTLSGGIVSVTLSPDAAAVFEEWTGQLAAQADAGQIAIIDAGGVLSAPVVRSAISGGEFQISGGDTADLQEIADRLRVLSAGVSFSVPGTKVG